jgi:hypothetical protein
MTGQPFSPFVGQILTAQAAYTQQYRRDVSEVSS